MERGFEQTKRCYLTEVIPFFNLLKEHFEGIQKSLVTEVRAMKAVFENLEAEVDQNETDLRSGEIERKNLLITNENLVAECLSKDVFYTATDFVLNVSRFSDMHDAFTSAQKHPTFDLKALVSQNKDLTAKLNALHDLNECFSAENAKAQLKENSKCVTIHDRKPKVLTPGRYPIDVEPIPPRLKKNREVHLHYIKRLKENVETLREIVEDAKVERPLDTSLASAFRYTKHSQELLEYVIGTCHKDFGARDKQNASTNSLRKKGVTFVEPVKPRLITDSTTSWHKKIKFDFTFLEFLYRSKRCLSSLAGQSLGQYKEKIGPLPAKVVQIVLWYLDSGCSKHMTGDRSWLRNFMKKFIGTVRFGKDHFGAIMGYGDYVISDSITMKALSLLQKTRYENSSADGVDERKESQILLKMLGTCDYFSKAPLFLLWAEIEACALLPGSVPNSGSAISMPMSPLLKPRHFGPVTSYLSSFDHDAPSGSHSSSSSAHQSSSVHHGVATEHSFEVNSFAATEHEPFVNVSPQT
ncbi:hypothetical protein Tco_0221430 [Tanacetum coccineum]